MTHTHTNRLAQETSPYLLQHAHNPVDWYPWGAEALERAAAEQRVILLSVGYSACHWCHVMERESFENADIAAIMNMHFVCVKVDREERPDIDTLYMGAVQLMTGQGGWPMTVFLTPDGKPFYGGTYYPPTDMYGRPGFPRVLQAVAEAWQRDEAAVATRSADILDHIAMAGSPDMDGAPIDSGVMQKAAAALRSNYDRTYGGFGAAPKFPQPAILDFLLMQHARTGDTVLRDMAEATLRAMAEGGIADQLGGGFHRYSTDAEWLAPHFEKMLYDQAQLVTAYVHAYQSTANTEYRRAAVSILDYVLLELTGELGQFYSAQDADSEGVEGKYFVWTAEEVDAIAGDGAPLFRTFYDVSPRGNWEGHSILRRLMSLGDAAKQHGMTLAEAEASLAESRRKMLDARRLRIPPATDDKALTSWNGLMAGAFALAGAVFDEPRYVEAAARNARFVSEKMAFRDEAGALRLLHSWRDGQARINGFLEDYAYYGFALLQVYATTLDEQWLRMALSLCDSIVAYFLDADLGGFFATASDQEQLVQRPRDWDDNATPSGNSVAVDLLLRAHGLTGSGVYRAAAEEAIAAVSSLAGQHPTAFARLLAAVDLRDRGPVEVVVAGASRAECEPLVREALRTYEPGLLVVARYPGAGTAEGLPVTEGRAPQADGPLAWVCRQQSCSAPVRAADALQKLIRP